MKSLSKAVFLDRDGTINQSPPEGWYITSARDLHLLPGATEAIARLYKNGFLVFVVTNQRCIARGIVPAEVVSQIHERLINKVSQAGGRIEQIYVCPHENADDCKCRKPKPGMLLQAAREHQLDLSQCWMVGDTASDVAAGHEAGCRTIYIGQVSGMQADFSVPNILEAVQMILAQP